jgi:SAM-dependent methyltransferase
VSDGAKESDLRTWPGRDRREPSLSDPHYLVLSPLAAELRRRTHRRFSASRDARVLDVGCGVKPYWPLIAPYAASYRGLDFAHGPAVDDVGRAESLPYESASFDLVLCTQVLEHVSDPTRAVQEICRVLAPSGLALVSTHGVFLYHPDPMDTDRDYWRWTHSGLRKLFSDNGDWDRVDVVENGNFVACVTSLLAVYLDEAARRRLPHRVRRSLVATLNRIGGALDRRYPPRARVPLPGSLTANYLVCAQRPTTPAAARASARTDLR